MKKRMLGYVCVLGGILIFVGVIVLYGSFWGLAIMALGGLLMAPIWLPALQKRQETNYSPFLSAFGNWSRKRRS